MRDHRGDARQPAPLHDRRRASGVARRGDGLAGHGNREGERRAAAETCALGREPLREREPEAVARRGTLHRADVPAKEMRQALPRHSKPLA